MAAIQLLLQIIIKNYIFDNSLNNCILHFTPTTQQILPNAFENTTSYHFTNVTLFRQIPERCDCIMIWDLKNSTSNFTETILDSIDHQLLYGSTRFRYNNRRIIVVTDKTGNAAEKIFTSKSLHFVMHFLLLSWKPDNKTMNNNENPKELVLKRFLPTYVVPCGEIDLFTHKYVGTDGNKSVQLDTFDVCTKRFQKDAILFPDKKRNQHGRPFKISTSDKMPRVDIETKTGSILILAMEYARIHNNTFIINEMDYSDPSKIPKFISGPEIFARLIDGRSDLGIRSLFLTYERYKNRDATAITFQSEATVLVPKATYVTRHMDTKWPPFYYLIVIFSEIDGWKVYTSEFSIGAWLLFLLSLLIHSVIITVMKKYFIHSDTLSPCAVYTIAVQQSMPSAELPKTPIMRWFTIAMSLQAVLVVSMYTSQLASNFTNPYYHGVISTIEDFADSDVEWGTTELNLIIPVAYDSKELSKRLFKKFGEYTLEEMKRRVNSGERFAIMANRIFVKHLAFEDIVDEKNIVRYKIIKDNLFTAYNTAYLRRSSIMTESVSKFIMLVFECGLMEIWDKQAFYSEIKKPINQYISKGLKDDLHPKHLSLVHLYSIFSFWFGGLIIASFAFLCEIVSNSYTNNYNNNI